MASREKGSEEDVAEEKTVKKRSIVRLEFCSNSRMKHETHMKIFETDKPSSDRRRQDMDHHPEVGVVRSCGNNNLIFNGCLSNGGDSCTTLNEHVSDQNGYQTFHEPSMGSTKDSSPGKSDTEDLDPVSGIRLRKELGLSNSIAIIVGTIIGSGIFVSPRGVLQEAGSVGLSLIVWVSCGILTTIGALCYAELGTSIPKSGGDYAYIKEAFGPLPAFLFLWGALFVTLPTANTIAALTLANYVLQPFYPGCEPPENAIRLIAALAICESLSLIINT